MNLYCMYIRFIGSYRADNIHTVMWNKYLFNGESPEENNLRSKHQLLDVFVVGTNALFKTNTII